MRGPLGAWHIHARAEPDTAIGDIPDGAACYRASVRRFTTLDLPADLPLGLFADTGYRETTSELRPGDLCLTLGAGDLTTLPTEVLAALDAP